MSFATASEICQLMLSDPLPAEFGSRSGVLIMDLLESHSRYERGRFAFVKTDDGLWTIYWQGKALPWALHLRLGLPGEYRQPYLTLIQAVMVTERPRFQEILAEIDQQGGAG